ncbi:MAG: alpha/beta hydrolase [Chloroflexi bacterium]|nr:alpha/beta hydrolase [Chloroflexota bacterium]
MSFTHPIPSQNFGSDGPDLFFLHANGYPPGCYRPLFESLAKHVHIRAMIQRPLWPNSCPEDLRDWSPFSEDLIRFLDENASSPPTVVLGHSMGGIAALRAALRRPDLFRRLILLDPVLLPPAFILLWRIALRLNFAHRFHPHIVAASNRRREFDDLGPLFERYRGRETFRYMDDVALRMYIEGITRRKENGGYQLLYSPEWETRVYYASIWNDMDIWRALPKLNIPTLILRGGETDTFWAGTARKVIRLNPSIRVETIQKSTHLVPLERPQDVADKVIDFLK